MPNQIKSNSNSRVIIIQKLYGSIFNRDEKIDFPKHRFKKFIKDVTEVFPIALKQVDDFLNQLSQKIMN